MGKSLTQINTKHWQINQKCQILISGEKSTENTFKIGLKLKRNLV